MRLFNFAGLLALTLTAVLILASCSDSKTSTGVSLERHHRAEGLEGLNNTVRLLTATTPAPQCGNLILEDGEQCDTADSSTCLSCNLVLAKGEVVATEYCGNGITEPGEQCDAGNNNNNEDGCTRYCKRAICGDGYVQPSNGEVCDYKSTAHNNGLLCTESCQIPGSMRADTIDCVGSTCMVPVPKQRSVKDPSTCNDWLNSASSYIKSVKYPKNPDDLTDCNGNSSYTQPYCTSSSGTFFNEPNCSQATYNIMWAPPDSYQNQSASTCASGMVYSFYGWRTACPAEHAEALSRCPGGIWFRYGHGAECDVSSSSSSSDSSPASFSDSSSSSFSDSSSASSSDSSPASFSDSSSSSSSDSSSASSSDSSSSSFSDSSSSSFSDI